MPFAPAPRRPVSEVVFDDLRAAILSGRFAPGEALPSERLLSESFAVNRHAVREALKRLQQAGLVEVNHGGATRVLDWRRTGGLDLLPHLAFALDDGPDAVEGLRSILEMRRSLGIDVARLAARRITANQLAALRASLDPPTDAEEDDVAVAARYEELWRTLVAASDNLAYTLAYNSLLEGTHAVTQLAHPVYAAESADPGAQRALVDAISGGHPDQAAALADALLSRSLASGFPTPANTTQERRARA